MYLFKSSDTKPFRKMCDYGCISTNSIILSLSICWYNYWPNLLAPVFQGFHMFDIAPCDFICTCQITQSAHLLRYIMLKFGDYFLPGSWDILYFMKSRESDVISNCQLIQSAQFLVMYLSTKFNNFSCSRSWNISNFYVYLLIYFILYVTFSQIYLLADQICWLQPVKI